ncbi:MAG TPA: glycoside hydrolase family 130 protein [Planctomycetia bacterium]|nr:glycoside hydrolase family 130 protein [Planctomycetia bacterium]
MSVHVKRLPIQLLPDASRVITRYFGPGEVNRIRDVIGRLLAVSESEVVSLVADLERDFRKTHPDLEEVFREHYEVVKQHVPSGAPISDARRRFIGACFTMEYAIESAALFNPSMVPAIDQENVPPGSVRFIMSLRATGEGHVSSIVFRRGLVGADSNVSVDPPGRYSRPLRATVPVDFAKADFISQLQSLHAWTDHAQAVLALLGDRFTRAELSEAIDRIRGLADVSGVSETSNDAMLALSQANYRLSLPDGADISEAVIFPFSDNERRGIEDLRLVRFTDDDGSSRYYGTYTAYDGFQIFPHLVEYPVGGQVEVRMLTGRCAKNKGMALFPRKIRGKYAMAARLDNENLYYMESERASVWNDARLLLAPKYPWEAIQIGNCGAPLETDSGWLLLTHGVGPMRQYCIGATLLDRDDPCRVIGQTAEPLLVPTGAERIGYVPNVVYSCGGMIHNGALVLPYAASDQATSIAVIDLAELLASLAPPPPRGS